jgi:hypothetical protein
VARRVAESEVNTAQKSKPGRKREMAVLARHLAFGKIAAGAAGQLTAVRTSRRELLGGRKVKTALHFKRIKQASGFSQPPPALVRGFPAKGWSMRIHLKEMLAKMLMKTSLTTRERL